MANQEIREKRKKKGRIGVQFLLRRIAAVLVFLLIIAAIVVTFTLFFHIKFFDETATTEIYTKQEITEASGIRINGSMFGFTARGAEKRIEGTLPYVAKVTVKRTLPSTVTIQVVEADNALVVPYQRNGYLILSRELDIIRTTEGYTGKALEIYGVTPVETSVGKVLEDEEMIHVENLQLLLDMMEKYHVLSGASAVNVSDRLNLEIVYDGRIYALLGTSSNLERKIRMLEEMVTNQLEPTDRGKLDLSVAGKATFAPMSEDDFRQIEKKVCTIG